MPATNDSRIDGLMTSVAVKAPVKAVTVTPVTLYGEQTVNGVACVANDRVLVRAQTDLIENGIYDVQLTAWVRSKDFDGNRDVVRGTRVLASDGFASYRTIGTDPILLGTSAILFATGTDPSSLPFVDFADYGAQDGVTDDSAALVEAIADAAGTILLISGDVYLASSVVAPVAVHVVSRGTITVAAGNTFTAMLITHEKERWMSGFGLEFDSRAFGLYTGLGVGVSMTAAFDAMVAALPAGASINFPAGTMFFNSKPAVISKSLKLVGRGISATQLARNYVEASPTAGFIAFLGAPMNGSSIHKIGLYAWQDSTGGTMLKFSTNTNEPAGFIDIHDTIVSYYDSSAQYVNGVLLDGSANLSSSAGLRDVHLSHVLFFASVGGTYALKCDNCGPNGDVVLAGDAIFTGASASANTQSNGTCLHMASIANVTFNYARISSITGYCDSLTLTANSQYISFDGMITSGTVSNAGANNRIGSNQTQASGTGQISNGGTSVTVNHGCAVTPTAGQIHITRTNVTTNPPGDIIVNTIGSVSFQVNCASDPGASHLTFGWQVDASK